ncbi:Vitamin K epoxide reductase [Pseudonocardia dioxanivorans CB1190]|uniref:Vitamin K epoxide reductase n=1 Tax=Pseudonocardia dioxanivorans (strain ATCC 55486 / DSM 44775 / JCM 13855 / CB1190) TaxID=675635 RepID=F4CXE6_PSEUX|nr:vitamin K epoxide reductase family protein [Pseudonocardia dioxanivorans]AEA26520.1 Vitamin K epoxide reductase [Pseudonocardia dioxanivorans CB1190]
MLRVEPGEGRSAAHQPADLFPRLLPAVLLIGGAIGLVASIVLTVERTRAVSDADYVPSCDLGAVVSCGSVMRSAQASMFGFPNSMIGIAGFAIVLTTGAVLAAGARPRPWFWMGLQAGAGFGAAFVHVLIFVTLYRIGAVCPYCMVVWVVTMTIFWYVTLRNLHHSWSRPGGSNVVAVLIRYHSVPVVLWVVTVAVLVVTRFWAQLR